MNNIKRQNFAIFCFKIMKHKFFTINKPNIMKKSKYQQYFHCFIVCIIFPYAFWFSCQENIVTIPISAAFNLFCVIFILTHFNSDCKVLLLLSQQSSKQHHLQNFFQCIFSQSIVLRRLFTRQLFPNNVCVDQTLQTVAVVSYVHFLNVP